MNHFGERLKQLRTSKHLSVTKVSKELGVSQSTYRDWEYGRSIIGEPYVKLAEIFNVSLSEILKGRQESVESELLKIEELIKIIRKKL
jgi:transcriptional regulator with XRE-family HTH domain